MFSLSALNKHYRLLLLGFVAGVSVLFIGYLLVSYSTNQNIAVSVNGETVSKDFFNNRVSLGKNFYTNVSSDSAKLASLEKDEMEEIILAVLGEQELKKQGLTVTEEEIDASLETKISEFEKQFPDLDYETFLKNTYRMTLSDQRYVIKRQIVKEKLSGLQVKKRLSAIWLAMPNPSDNPEILSAEHKAANEKKLDEAKQILAEAKTSADFGELVTKYSEDAISKEKKGDLGFYPFDELFPSTKIYPTLAVLRSAYEKLSQGQTDVFEYPTGYSVIKVTDVQGDWNYLDYADFAKKAREQAKVKLYVEIE